MAHILEGTWDEIKAHEAEFAGHRLTVIINDGDSIAKPKTPEEWSQEWLEWTDSHVSNTLTLSEEAMDRDSFYEERS